MGIIAERSRQALMERRKNYPVHSNRASEMGHPCVRYLYYLRTAWEERPLPDIGLLEVFEEGKAQEKATEQFLRDNGFVIVEQQRALHYPEHQITGQIDGKVYPSFDCPEWPKLADGRYRPLPCEIKSMSPFIYAEVNSYEDIVNSKHHWVRKYPAQIQLYNLMSDEPVGIMLLKDKTGMRVKDIWIPLDYELAGAMLDKADRVNEAVASKTPPDRHETHDCSSCDFVHLCQPTVVTGKGLSVLDNEELAGLLDRRESLADSAKEYGQVDEQIKKLLPQEAGSLIVGDYLVETTQSERKPYEVKGGVVYRRSISKLGT